MKTTETSEAIRHIEEGTVIDHIPPGHGLQIIHLLKLHKHPKRVTIGLNLPSTQMGLKDLIKVVERELTPEEANQVALFAPEATISIIRNKKVSKKFQVAFPEEIRDCIRCPNSKCITNHEKVETLFYVSQQSSYIQLCCKFCSKTFSHDEISL